MTTRVLDRRVRSTQITLLASVGAGIALAVVVAMTALGGDDGRERDGGVPPVLGPSPTPTLPDASPTPDPTPIVDDGSDAMPIKVELENATGAEVHVDIVDRTGLLAEARTGHPGDGVSVESYTLAVEGIDATTLQLTWSDYPIDNALALYIDEADGGLRLVLVQPEPTGTTDAIAFDRRLILTFAEPVSVDHVVTVMQDGLDTPG